jgi:hypothetical protein
MTGSNHIQKIFTIIIYHNKYRGTILDPFVILSHIAKVSSSCTVRLWNGLPASTKSSPFLNILKTRLNSGTNASPKYFHIGDRKENIIDCQMRNDASNLNRHFSATSLISPTILPTLQ